MDLKSYLMPIILILCWYLLSLVEKNKSNENELDKKVGRVGAWILIGALGYLIFNLITNVEY